MTIPTERARRAAFVVNPIKVKDLAQLREIAEIESTEAGWSEPLWFETTVEDSGKLVALEALAQGADALLVAGGDGTVRSVAEAVHDTGVPLAIVPSGTGNLLARNIGLPLTDSAAIIRAVFEGETTPIDMGMARVVRHDGTEEVHGFVVLAGIGLDAAMIANTRPELKRRVGWLAYVDGAARSLLGAKPFRVTYQISGERSHSVKAHSLLFANCGALPAGIDLIPESSLADGMIDVAVFQPSGPFGWLAVFRTVWWDNSVLRKSRLGRRTLQRRTNRSVRLHRSSRVLTRPDEPRPIELDGDELGMAAELECWVAPGGLTLVVPNGVRLATRAIAVQT